MTYMSAWTDAARIAKETQEEAYVIAKHINGEWRYDACMASRIKQAMRDGWSVSETLSPPNEEG